MLLALIFLGLIGFALGGCPPNSIGLKLNASICYSFHPSLSQYVIAERECNSFGANLVSMSNRYTNVYVTQLANLFFKHLELDHFWTNGHRLIDAKTFRWLNGDEIDYGNNLMNNRTEDDQDCMAVNLEKGFWKHEDCFTRLPFVCEFVGDKKIEVPPTAITFETFKNFEVLRRLPQMSMRELIPTTTKFSSITSTSTATSTASTPPPATTTSTSTSTTTTATTTTTTTPALTTTPPEVCPPTWTYYNGYCYGVFRNMSWNEAEEKCVQEEAHLASIHNRKESLFVAKLPGDTSWFRERSFWHEQTLIGLITRDGKTWEWSDGTSTKYIQWAEGKPNNSLGVENCGQLWSSPGERHVHLGEFNNFACHTVTKHFVCKKLSSTVITSTTTNHNYKYSSLIPTMATIPLSTPTENSRSCPASWTYNNVTSYCYGLFHNMTWNDAEQKCIEEGAHLTSIHSREESYFVARLLGPQVHKWSGHPYIGLHTKDKGESWEWSDGTPVDYLQWSIGEPNNAHKDEYCGQIWNNADYLHAKFGDFNDCPCNTIVEKFLCKRMSTTGIKNATTTAITTSLPTTTIPLPTPIEPKACPPSWIYNNVTGHCYGLFHNMSWNDAENKCIQEHSHLTSIHSKEEALFVATLTQNTSISGNPISGGFWGKQTCIGLITKDKTKTWQWTDGTPTDYLPWVVGEPNNPGIENCGQIWISANSMHVKFGEFNNCDCNIINKNFVCKKMSSTRITSTTTPPLPSTTPVTTTTITTAIPLLTTTKPKTCPSSWTYNNVTGYCYGVYHNTTWNDAEQICVQEQAHLTSIHSKEEGLFVASLTQNTSISGHPASSWGYQTHIGLITKDKGKIWKWSDGTPVDYVNWGINEPDPHPWPILVHCGQIWSSASFMHVKSGDFNDRPCDLITTNFVCKKLPN